MKNIKTSEETRAFIIRQREEWLQNLYFNRNDFPAYIDRVGAIDKAAYMVLKRVYGIYEMQDDGVEVRLYFGDIMDGDELRKAYLNVIDFLGKWKNAPWFHIQIVYLCWLKYKISVTCSHDKSREYVDALFVVRKKSKPEQDKFF